MFSWTLHQKGSPKRDGAAVAVRHELYYFGRNSDENKNQIGVQVFNTVTLLWRKLIPVGTGRGERHLEVPPERAGHTAMLIADIVYLWGGCMVCRPYKFCNLLYAFDVDSHRWFKPQVSGAVPEGRSSQSACVLGKVMYVHGGIDTYKLDTTTMVWSLINTRGTPVYGLGCPSVTIVGTKMFVFGENQLKSGWWTYYNSYIIKVFDTETNQWMNPLSAPSLLGGRWLHSAFTYNGELYIFGPLNTQNDLWKFSPETFSWKKVGPNGKGPPPTNHMCCCRVGERVILFGGRETAGDLFVLDFSPSLKTLCKLAVIQCGLDRSELPHNIMWELEAMTTNST